MIWASVLLPLFLCLPQSVLDPERPFLAVEELDLYYTNRRVCGVISVYAALTTIGRPARLADIAAAVPITERGSSLNAMCAYLERQGVENAAVQLHSLQAVFSAIEPDRRSAILSVDGGSHYVTVFRRTDGDVSVFEAGSLWQEQRGPKGRPLASRYSGVAVVLGEGASAAVWRASATRSVIWSLTALGIGMTLGALVASCRRWLSSRRGGPGAGTAWLTKAKGA